MGNLLRVPAGSSRFSDDDRARISAGRCTWQTGYGLPWSEFCQKRLTGSERANGQVYCTEHENDLRDNHPRSPLIRLTRDHQN